MHDDRTMLVAGLRIGHLVLIEMDPTRTRKGLSKWLCQCDCGAVASIPRSKLWDGHVRSCGCASTDGTIKRNTRHGFATRSGQSAEYTVWQNMRNRCQSPTATDYPYYGGRGITVCPEWADFEVFYRDMGPKPSPHHTIDRTDVNGPYSRENCQWATRLEQANNRRSNIHLTHHGLTMTLAEWARHLHLPYPRLLGRIRRGWPTERVLS